jgi:mono/diheme cytochrome c family protein
LLFSACGQPRTNEVDPDPDPFLPPTPPSRPDGFAGGAGGFAGGVGDFPGPAVSAEKAPPPLSGGTLLVLRDGETAFAADPDRDAVYLADLKNETLLARLPLQPGDEPGRSVEDGAGRVHVVLRSGRAIATVDVATRALVSRRPVCPAPRGIAYDAAADRLYVACAGGELLTLAPTSPEPLSRVRLDRDLRDVVVSGDRLFVSLFRSAEILVVSPADGKVLSRVRPAGSSLATSPTRGRRDGGTASNDDLPTASVNVAWRMRALPNGDVAVVHQEGANDELGTQPGGYGAGPCGSVMGAAVTRIEARGRVSTSPHLARLVLPVDFAQSPNGRLLAVLAAGNSLIPSQPNPPAVSLMDTNARDDHGRCGHPVGAPLIPGPDGGADGQPPPEPIELRQPVGEPIAIAFDGLGRVLVQSREPARLEILTHRGGTIKLSTERRADSGHRAFHGSTSNGLACASCHPEGGDDGRNWRFAKLGVRRTQNLRGGIMQTAPFHWDGDMRDLDHLMHEVFMGRMAGPRMDKPQVAALARWMDRIPALPPTRSRDDAAVERGRVLFNDSKVACASCHTGPLLTNNQTVDVGTGGPKQVPPLIGVGWRAPFMSNGCAPTLTDRFKPSCGGADRHGVTSHLNAAQLADLVAYMESL